MRVRPGGSHHQKFVVIRHPDRPELDVAFVGGIDLCHSRRDDATHRGDRAEAADGRGVRAIGRPGTTSMTRRSADPRSAYVEATFRERWQDPAPLTRNPLRRLADAARHDDDTAGTAAAAAAGPGTGADGHASSCCAPIRTGGGATRSRRTGNAAWRAAIARRSDGRRA